MRAGFRVRFRAGNGGSRLADTSHNRPRTSSRAGVAGDDQGMDMQMSIGVLDERAVDRAMEPHVPAMVDCFERAGDARRYLSGQVVLRFVVEASGSVSDIHVIKNELGNYPVERCLIDVGRRIAFPRPEGNRRTDFEYSLRFRSTGEMRVLNWNGDDVANRVASTNDFSSRGNLGTTACGSNCLRRAGWHHWLGGFRLAGAINRRRLVCRGTDVQTESQRRPSERGSAHGVSHGHCRAGRGQG